MVSTAAFAAVGKPPRGSRLPGGICLYRARLTVGSDWRQGEITEPICHICRVTLYLWGGAQGNGSSRRRVAILYSGPSFRQ